MSVPFSPRYWDKNGHRHKPLSEPWEDVWPTTSRQYRSRRNKNKPATARYHSRLTERQVRVLEKWVVERGEQYRDFGHVRYYYADATELLGRYGITLDFFIGASDGEQTNLLHVEYAQCGSVHGRPILLSELRKKGFKPNKGLSQ